MSKPIIHTVGGSGAQPAGIVGKLMYGFLFVVLLPLFLILWAWLAAVPSQTPMPHSFWGGVALVFVGSTLMVSGTIALWIFGRGLPMSPYPPSQYVARGIYKYLAHPLYVGFCFLTVGAAVAMNSASGFWLVSPTVILSCMAFVYGHERAVLDERFGEERKRPLLRLPGTGGERPSPAERVAVLFLVLASWVLVYELAVLVTPFENALNLTSEAERRWPVLEWTGLVYASTYIWVSSAPWLAVSRRQLREFAVAGLIAALAGTACFFLIPVTHTPRPFEAQTVWGRLLIWGQNHDNAGTTFPAFHLVWTMLTARLFYDRFPNLISIWSIWAAAVAASCVTTGMHSLTDLVGALVLVIAIWCRHAIWEKIRRITQSLSNSWRAWRVGPVRIINHSIYAGLAAFVGYVIVAILQPDIGNGPILMVSVSGIIGGALFAQWVEGSSRLLRPFGYFGAIIGSGVGVALSVLLFGAEGMSLLAALAVAAPFVQAIGRLRCLVQGCCHGRLAAKSTQGIRYYHPSTRVVHLADLGNSPVYPTPLYSIAGNLMIGFLLVRLWSLHVPESLISGLYFILAGLGRFVEEAFRGEPQTPVYAGLRVYQWWSIGFIVLGATLTCLPSGSAIEAPIWRWNCLLPALIAGLLWGAATGVDLPESNARFTRLTG